MATHYKHKTGTITDSINIYKSENGENVFIDVRSEINEIDIISATHRMKIDEFRELVKDVL